MNVRHSKWRMAISMISVILSTVSALDKQSRLLPVSSTKDFATNSIKSHAADLIKTDGNGKTIDYTLYNYGGSAVLSLTKDKATGLNFNDTQASTIAALGNAALILGGALLFGQLNNRIQAKAQQNLYARGFKSQYRLPEVPVFRKRKLRRFRKRRPRPVVPVAQLEVPLEPVTNTAVYSQRYGQVPPRQMQIGGRRRLRRKYLQNSGATAGSGRYRHTGSNQRINDYGLYPQTRDQVSVPLRDETYSSETSVLDPIKPMFANDPYSFYEEPVMMDDYYYEDYYDSIPDFSPLKGNQIQTKSIPPVPKKPVVEEKPELFVESRQPSRNEMLLKMSEEKRLEDLRKERAKLLEATIMKPQAMSEFENEQQSPFSMPSFGQDKPTEKELPRDTRSRIPLRQMRQRKNVPQNEEEQRQQAPSFPQPPMAAFQTTFNRPRPNPSDDMNTNPVEDPFTFRQDVDPFAEMADFDVDNEDWISTISQAFEGFSDFKKLKK